MADRLYKVFDVDHRNEINFKQFLSLLSVFSKHAKREEKLNCTGFNIVAFKIYDVDGDGIVDYGDLFYIIQEMVGSSMDEDQVDAIAKKTILEADLDHDGAISFGEFKRAMFNTDIESLLTIEL